jgi:hypothetical protein
MQQREVTVQDPVAEKEVDVYMRNLFFKDGVVIEDYLSKDCPPPVLPGASDVTPLKNPVTVEATTDGMSKFIKDSGATWEDLGETKWEKLLDSQFWSMCDGESFLSDSDDGGNTDENFPPAFHRSLLIPKLRWRSLGRICRAPWEIAMLKDRETFEAVLSEPDQDVFWFCTLCSYWPFRTWFITQRLPQLKEDAKNDSLAEGGSPFGLCDPMSEIMELSPDELALRMWPFPSSLTEEILDGFVQQYRALPESQRKALCIDFQHPAQERILACVRETFWGPNAIQDSQGDHVRGIEGLRHNLGMINDRIYDFFLF